LNTSAETPSPTSAKNRPNRKTQWLAALLILAVAALAIFLHLGDWLVLQDPLVTADVIVVLSGRMPLRALEAARLYGQKAAPTVWLTKPWGPSEELATMNIPFVGEEMYSEKVLLAKNVPATSIQILPDRILNTQQEIEEIGRIARQSHLQTVVIVTSAPHTRRVRTIWNHIVGDSPRLIVRHPLDDSFDGAHWWRSTQDALDVVREWLGLVNAWAGFPATPSRN
jgi:uncharacterized SAM-binding protein YcdF (DUF218 family)